jgi:hypothetical protein
MRTALLVLAIAAAPAAVAQAQDVTAVPQIVSPAAADASAAQIEQHPGEVPPQLSAGEESTPGQSQLTSVDQSGNQTSQVSTAPRNAQPPHPLSTPDEGRTAAVARVGGKDRCDPANAEDKKRAECKHVIETRSAEFARPSPGELSPEQKLLMDQRWVVGEDNLSSATRRLANSGDPDNSIESMAIASVVLNQNQADEAKKKPEQDPQTDAAIQAIISVLTVPPPQ